MGLWDGSVEPTEEISPQKIDLKNGWKLLWHFSINWDFKAIYAFKNSGSYAMSLWGIIKDSVLHHPPDSEAWQYLDEVYHSFRVDIGNLRLGLPND